MHLRKLILVCGFAGTLLSNMAAALGLGEVRLNSTLNEPLNAEIKLLDTRGLSDGQVIVGLASPADFERNGVERLYFLTEFQFDVVLNHSSGPMVRVTSRSPVREPFLNFLVEARWPTGRLLREYTLLVDLPTFSDTAPAPSARPPVAQPAPSTTPRPAARPSPAPTTATPAPAPRQARPEVSGDTYTVGANDTLWQIALDIRPDSSHTVHQTMLAVQRLNPDAFINGNINLLRRGQVLRIPTGDDIRGINQREAVSEVGRQNQAWSDDSMGAQLSATRRDSGARRETQAVSGSLKLATPQGDAVSGGQGSGDNTGRGRALEAELASSLEELDKARGENRELSSRVRDLEEQIRTMERLVEVSNEQLRTLQLGAAQNQQPSVSQVDADTAYSDPAQESPRDFQADVQAEYEAGLTQADVEREEQPETAPVVTEQTPATVEPTPVDARRTVVPPQPSKTLVDHVMENLLWLVAGVVALIAAIALVISRRRKADAEFDEAADDNLFDTGAIVQDDEYDAATFEAMDNADEEDVLAIDDEDIPAEAETGDVVGEADIYIAYGKFDQAEEMLLNALEKDPDSIDIRLKLLEVYSQTQDVQKFDRYYAGLFAFAGTAALARAADLRAQIAGAGDFEQAVIQDGKAYGESVDIADMDDGIDLDSDVTPYAETSDDYVVPSDLEIDDELLFDVDLDDEPAPLLEEQTFTTATDVQSGASRYDLSFDELDSEAAVTNDETPVADVANNNEEEEEFSFDFDLDDSSNAVAEPVSETNLTTEDEALDFDLDLDLDEEPPVTVPTIEPVSGEELSFEFDESFEEPKQEAERVEDAPFVQDNLVEEELLENELLEDELLDEELELPDDAGDDFNLDMEMGDLDLAALDEEMEDLDADFATAEGSNEFGSEPEAEVTAPIIINDTTDTDIVDLEVDEEFSFDRAEVVEAEEQPVLTAAAEDPLADDDDLFDQALSEFDSGNSGGNIQELDELTDEDMDAELDFLADTDEAATKLDLARAYIDMGDTDGARDILAEVAHEGNEQQREEAVNLLSRIDA